MALLVQQFEFNLFDVNQLLPLKTTVSGRVSYTNFAKQLFIRIRNTQAKLYKHSQYGLSLVMKNSWIFIEYSKYFTRTTTFPKSSSN